MMDRLISKNQIIKAEGGEGTLKPRKPNATYKDEIDWLNGNNEDDSVVHGGFICSSIPSEYKHKVNAHEASGSNLYWFGVGSGRILHTLKGHTDKICTVDSSRQYVVSAGQDQRLKIWDIQGGYYNTTAYLDSN
ncbi:uncharacterized protein LOC131241489 isoform X3 [Magnolia sinica]|uniref:uncharacterized protein LOC131241489 isoform X3 n=1 Tax=Magnolia sinica TaxID=86752 RepID=UPI0026586751|nr:uncharacterized protein LOC131241489 isoform X3 [Magnolia sinica]